jgi:hypothetical protein
LLRGGPNVERLSQRSRARTLAALSQDDSSTLTKIVFLHDAGVDPWDLSCLNPNRTKWLVQIGWKSTNQYLQRMVPERRYPVLITFLQQALLHHTDVAMELFDQCVWGCHSEAK